MSKTQPHRRVPGLNLLAIGMIAGLLIWAKLRLVTDFPRIVQADPNAQEVEPPASDTVDSTPTGSGRDAVQTDDED